MSFKTWWDKIRGNGIGGPQYDDQGNYQGEPAKIDLDDTTQTKEIISNTRKHK